jgi:hypothetical protein
MTPDQSAKVKELLDKGHTPMSAARCLDGISYREIADEFGEVPHPADRLSPALRRWWMQQSWVWRPDNREPIEAPWERIKK